MKRNHNLPTILLILVVALFLAGCARTQPSRFYLLQPVGNPGTGGSSVSTGQGLTVGIGPVDFPKYLDRPQIVTRTGETEVKLAEFNRWAEPIQDNFSRVLAENLSAVLPTDRIDIFPFRTSQAITYQVLVEVISFGGDPGGNALVSARWTILQEGGNKELITRKSVVTVASGGEGYAALVSAQSQAIANLSEEIAAAIKADLQSK